MSNNGTDNFEKRVYGLVIIKSKMSNWNADFTGYPRRLPDEKATIYATDKAFKYAIRNYWVSKSKNVFVWKSFKNSEGKLIPLKLSERMEEMKRKLGNDKTPIQIFMDCIDTKLFGITYAKKGSNNDSENISLTGAVQISYGINRMKDNTVFNNSILSPYRNDSKKDVEAKQSTIGNENKALEPYYVYDFSVNPKNLTTHYEDNKEIKELLKITGDDIDSLKEALKKAATYLETDSKKGSDNVMLLWVEVDDDKVLPSMKSLVSITKNGDKTEVDLSKVMGLLNRKGLNGNVEIYAEKSFIEVEGAEGINIEDL